SGTALDQLERWAPRALRSFRTLAETGAVELLAETSHHSLCGLEAGREFEHQVRAHAQRIEATFRRRPTTFRHTEPILSGAGAKTPDAVVGLFMDFETFGEHHAKATGILSFLDRLPEALLAAGVSFATPAEAAESRTAAGTLRLARPLSWADEGRDVSAWLG